MADSFGVSKLRSRLRPRRYENRRVVYYLDLRGDEWGNLGRVVLRKPGTEGWPAKGPTTDDEATARGWVGHEDYLELVHRHRTIARLGPAALTVREGMEKYLDHLKETKGEDHPTYRNRATSLLRHTEPLHSRILGSLSRPVVQDWLDGVRVDKGGEARPPARATKAALFRGLRALWHFHLRSVEPPFDGALLGSDERARSIREAIEGGRGLDRFVANGAYGPDELNRLLVAARWYFRQVIEPSAPLRATTMDSWAEAIVLMAGTSARLMEATRLQWQHIREEEGLLIIPGTKTKAALRAQPLQESLRPWLEHLRETFRSTFDREPGRLDFLIQSDPRQPRSRPVSRSLGERVGRIQEVAGLKRPQRSAHILRATFISSAHARGIPSERLKHYVGHAQPGKGSSWDMTDDYIHFIAGLAQEEDRHVMDHIPHPEEVARKVSAFRPTRPFSSGAGAGTERRGRTSRIHLKEEEYR